MSEGEVICANPDCHVAEDAKCVEGLELDKCPFYGKSTEETAPPVESGEESEEAKRSGVALDLSTALDGAAASDTLRRSLSRVVGIVGAHDSGKTSLIAGLYDLFQTGTVGNVTFAGSFTLHAFEQVCHDARAASLRNVAHSPRTERGEVRFYHLDLKPPRCEKHLSLLIGDRNGEEYEEVADDVSNAAPMFELRRAGAVTILVDGERLCDTTARHEAVSAVPLIVQGLFDGGAFEHRPRLAVVLTKHDAVLASGCAERAMRDFDRILAALRRKHSDSFSAIEPFVTAASPKGTEIARGAGLPHLLAFWLEPTDPPEVPLRAVVSDRVFDNLQPIEE
jgi:hypothetical protein